MIMRDYMETMRIVLDDYAFAPVRAHEDDAGLDLRSPDYCEVPAHGSCVIDTGIHIELPKGTTGFLKSKSGLNVDHGIVSEGVIDCGYTGSIRVKLFNHSDTDYIVSKGDKISQLVVLPYIVPRLILVNKLDETERGDGGFGSTGR
jgi:dUTP pyrophosphatase